MIGIIPNETIPELLLVPCAMVLAPPPCCRPKLIELFVREYAGKLLLDYLSESQSFLPPINTT